MLIRNVGVKLHHLVTSVMAQKLIFCCVIVTLICGINGAATSKKDGRALDPFSFEDIFDPAYRYRSFSGRWIGETEFLFRANSGDIMRFNAADKTQSVFVSNDTFTSLSSYTWFVSEDLQYVLFAYDTTPLWRHSYSAKYKILTVDTGDLTDFPNGPLANSDVQYASWSPTDHALSFVYGNNLYYQASPTDVPVQLTDTGVPDYVFNGVPDWLYEEDVLSSRVTHYWSADSRYICYAVINTTGVPLQAWPWYGDKSDVYGKTIQIAYPKAGHVVGGKAGPNSQVTMRLYDSQLTTDVELQPPPSYANVDHYFTQVAWRNTESVMITWANRVQNESISSIYNVSETSPTPIENLKLTQSGGWIQVEPATPHFIDDGENYFTVLPRNVGTTGNWRHLAMVTSDGATTFLTNGEEEIQKVVGVDSALNLVYYVSTGGDPSERHVYRVKYEPLGEEPECLTCDMPDSCRYMSANFGENAKYYLLNCHGPDIPVYYLRNSADSSDRTTMEDNDELRANLATKALPTREFFDVSVGDGYTGRAEIFYPPDHGEGHKYRLLIYAYAGPGSQRVMKTFPMGSSTSNWLTYLKSTHKIAIASLDGRGSAAAGDKLKFEMYRRLSTVEVQDQIAGAQHFAGMPNVDDSLPLGIFGWSYGGGVAAHVIGDTTDVVTCGLSVAPVSSKAYYDTAYTERYLGMATPDDNQGGYNGTDVMNKVANFANKKFFIAHGTADDNVHYMHTAQLISALANEGISFRQNLYMDQHHGITTRGQSRHLYQSMTDFLLNDCWGTQHSVSDADRPASSVVMATTLAAAAAAVLRLLQ